MYHALDGAVAAASKLGLTKEAVTRELRTIERLSKPLLPRISGRALQPGQVIDRGPGRIAQTYGGPAVTDALEASLQNARRRYGTKAPKALAEYEDMVALMRETAAKTPYARPIKSIAALTGGQESRSLPGEGIELGAASAPEAMLAAHQAVTGFGSSLDSVGGAMAAALGRSPDLAHRLLLEDWPARLSRFADVYTKTYTRYNDVQHAMARAAANRTNPNVSSYAKRRLAENESLRMPFERPESVPKLREQALRSLANAASAGPVINRGMRNQFDNTMAHIRETLIDPEMRSAVAVQSPEGQAELMRGLEERIRRALPGNLRTQLGLRDQDFTGGL